MMDAAWGIVFTIRIVCPMQWIRNYILNEHTVQRITFSHALKYHHSTTRIRLCFLSFFQYPVLTCMLHLNIQSRQCSFMLFTYLGLITFLDTYEEYLLKKTSEMMKRIEYKQKKMKPSGLKNNGNGRTTECMQTLKMKRE